MTISDRAACSRMPVNSGVLGRKTGMRGPLPALAVLLPLLMILPVGAFAQAAGPACVASADSMPGIPAGSSDFGVSDVTVNCTGGNAGDTISFNLKIDLSAPVSGLTASIQTAAGSYQGFRVTANSVTWQGVVLPPPGASGVRTFKISGVRINAAQAASGTVLMFFEISGAPAIAISNLTLPVGNVAPPASPLTCSVSAADPPQIPSTNTDAAVADVTLQCIGGQAGMPAAISLQVYLTADVTSQTAALITDSGSSQGSRISSHSITWPSVVVIQPGPGGTVSLRMAGIRVNAATSAGGPVMAYVTASSLSSVVMSSSQAVVGQVAGTSTAPQVTDVNPVSPIATGLSSPW